jgi:hypothetical protein
VKIITYLNKDTNETQDLTLKEAIRLMRECFQYPESNEKIFEHIQLIMDGGLVQTIHHGFAILGDKRMKPEDNMTERKAFEKYKHKPGLYATTDIEQGEFGERDCVKIMGENDHTITILRPNHPNIWKRNFNALIAAEKGSGSPYEEAKNIEESKNMGWPGVAKESTPT